MKKQTLEEYANQGKKSHSPIYSHNQLKSYSTYILSFEEKVSLIVTGLLISGAILFQSCSDNMRKREQIITNQSNDYYPTNKFYRNIHGR